MLKPSRKDTPHTAALKQRRAQLLREYHEAASRLKQISPSKHNSPTHLETHYSPSPRRNVSPLTNTRKLNKMKTSSSPNSDPASIAEENLKRFEEYISHVLPMTNPIPSRLRTSIWKEHVSTWKRALEGRAWESKVNSVCILDIFDS